MLGYSVWLHNCVIASDTNIQVQEQKNNDHDIISIRDRREILERLINIEQKIDDLLKTTLLRAKI